MKFFLFFLSVITIVGCQKSTLPDPYTVYWSGPPAGPDNMLAIDSLCEAISISAIRGGPPVECCTLNDNTPDAPCFPCPFSYKKRVNGKLQIEPVVFEPAISGDGIVLFNRPGFYLPKGELTPEVQQQLPWIRSVYKGFKLISIVYTARRCLERMPTPTPDNTTGKCLRWGEEEEFEQGFFCD